MAVYPQWLLNALSIDLPRNLLNDIAMNLRWMVLFATIAEEGSFTRAATRLNIAQPWLSAQIRKLEYEIGVQLLIRKSTGVQPTPEGEALLPYAKQLADAAQMFRDTARRLGDTQTKTVQLGSHLPMLDIERLREINLKFLQTYANFRLDANVAGTPELLERLERGDFDLIVALAPLPETKLDCDVVELQPLVPFLLAPRKAGISGLDKLKGRTVGVPPVKWHPEFVGRIAALLRDTEAIVRTVPEFDRRAMDHMVRVHGQPVIMINGNIEEYRADPAFTAIPLPDLQTSHLLIRAAVKEIGRGAERFWNMAVSFGQDSSTPDGS